MPPSGRCVAEAGAVATLAVARAEVGGAAGAEETAATVKLTLGAARLSLGAVRGSGEGRGGDEQCFKGRVSCPTAVGVSKVEEGKYCEHEASCRPIRKRTLGWSH